jgi:hypothetical protein
MATKFTKLSRTIFFIAVVIAFLIGLTRFNQDSRVASAENPLASDFLSYLQEAGHAVALNPDEVPVLAEELMQNRISERILYLSSEAAVNTNKKVLGSIYGAGILIVAIDTPITVLYGAVDTVSLGKNAPMESARKGLEDLIAPHDKLVVVSMIYSYNYMHHINGYSHSTDFYAYPENVEFAAQALVNSAEDEFNSADLIP